MKTYKLILGLILVLLFSQTAFSQKDTTEPKLGKGYFSISPFHFISNGLKLEYNVPLKNGNLFYVSPEFYSGKLGLVDSGRVAGIGVNTGIKYVFSHIQKRQEHSVNYFAFGVEGNYFNVEASGNIWVNKIVNNQSVLVLERRPVNRQYTRLGMQVLFGTMRYDESRFFYELAAGAALRHSINRFTEGYTPNELEDEFPWSYGWSGISPLIYFKLGVVLR